MGRMFCATPAVRRGFGAPGRRAMGALVLAGLLLALAAGGARAEEAVVRIDNFTFSPPNLTIPVGTTVTFENADDIPHTVVAKTGAFRSKALDTGDHFSFTFAKAGDFAYFCSLHPHMQGKITVTP